EGGTPLGDSVPLVQDRVYYAQAQDPGTGCGNPVRAMLTVDLSQCEPLDHGFFVPDGFSPNGDGRNDSFFVPNIGVIFPDFTLEIFNRYGSSLFKGNRGNPAWDGKGGSSVAPNGVYYYIINF